MQLSGKEEDAPSLAAWADRPTRLHLWSSHRLACSSRDVPKGHINQEGLKLLSPTPFQSSTG